MAPLAQMSVPSTAALPNSRRLHPRSHDVYKTLSRLSRPSILELVLEWLDDVNVELCEPYVFPNEDDGNVDAPYHPAQSIQELKEIYQGYQARKGTKREVIDRIVEGDWRNGLTLYQLAMAETRYIIDHPTSQRWNALKLVRKGDCGNSMDADPQSEESERLPRFHAHTFLLNLQREISSITKAHYYLTQPKDLPVMLLRLFLHDSPYHTQRSLHEVTVPKQGPSDTMKSIFVVFPNASPHVYVSSPTAVVQHPGGEGRSLQRVIVETVKAIPKAFSRPQARYALQTTNLATKSLHAMLSLRSSGRSNAAAGGWSIFAEGRFGHSALDYVQQRAKDAGQRDSEVKFCDHADTVAEKRPRPGEPDGRAKKRFQRIAEGRFGVSALEEDGTGIDRLQVRIDDEYPGTNAPALDRPHSNHQAPPADVEPTQPQRPKAGRQSRLSLLDQMGPDEEDANLDGSVRSVAVTTKWRPDVRLSFQGPHVFAGIRQLVELGIIDGEKMPGWMTGEDGVSIGVVRHGRMLRGKRPFV